VKIELAVSLIELFLLFDNYSGNFLFLNFFLAFRLRWLIKYFNASSAQLQTGSQIQMSHNLARMVQSADWLTFI
jgi:hypothetical protein